MTCVVKELKIGEGKPKICLPIVERCKQDILQRALSYQQEYHDLVELRIDYFEALHDEKQLKDLLVSLRKVLDCPILLTCRTSQEGGEVTLTSQDYIQVLSLACQSGCIDLVDIELSQGNLVVYQLVNLAHQQHICVVMSKHDFEKTPSLSKIQETLEKMEIMGGDILKVAYMPQNKQDVLTLINATMLLSEKFNQPLVTISMGELGKITRLCGELIGSAITFASVQKASAPGQINATHMHMLLEAIHCD